MKVSTILDSIDLSNMALPEFQRGYVWNRNQVRGFMQSLYRRYPVGSLLVWTTEAKTATTRGASSQPSNVVNLLLDGQQRITTLYGIMRGHPPPFFQGHAWAFKDLFFDVRTETFEFFGPVKMKGDPLWVDVTELYKSELAPWVQRLTELDLDAETQGTYIQKLTRILSITNIDLHIEEITGSSLTVDEVVDIFNRVNSGGTKLSKGDLALARICAAWPEARHEMTRRCGIWREVGFDFRLDWLLRVINAVLTGEAKFSALDHVSAPDFQAALETASGAVDKLLNLLSSRLGLDHDRVVAGRYAFPVMARYLTQSGSKHLDTMEEGLLLYWYVHAFLWGRHSGSTETALDQDLAAVDEGGLERLIEVLRTSRGDLVVRPENFAGAQKGARFYPLLYMLSRVYGARDLGSGNELSAHLLGKLSSLEVHHIFPKARLAELGFNPTERNALANFCFLTQETNLAISSDAPVDYLPKYEEAHPGVLASQWIPNDPALWEEGRYPDFLAARRDLLASAANKFLDSLRSGHGAPVDQGAASLPSPSVTVVHEEGEEELAKIAHRCTELGLSAPLLHHEVLDPESGEILAIADAAWPNGVQEGLGDPVAYLSEPDEDMEARLGELGYRFFTTEGRLFWYFEEVLGFDIDGDGVVGPVASAGGDSPGKTVWNRERLLEELARCRSEADVAVAERLLEWASVRMPDLWWGEGARYGSVYPGLKLARSRYPLFCIWTNGLIELQFQYMNEPPLDAGVRHDLRMRLNEIPGIDLPDRPRPSFPISALFDEASMAAFLTVCDWYVDLLQGT